MNIIVRVFSTGGLAGPMALPERLVGVTSFTFPLSKSLELVSQTNLRFFLLIFFIQYCLLLCSLHHQGSNAQSLKIARILQEQPNHKQIPQKQLSIIPL